MQSPTQIQMVHDVLVAILLQEVPVTIAEEDRRLLTCATDVLCWVLEHSHNQTFRDNIEGYMRALEAQGYVLKYWPTPITPQ